MGRGRRHRQDEKLDPARSSIAIIGSGLAGLSTAICLQQAGFCNITIYERDESFASRKEGYGMTLSYNPQGILAQLGVLEALARADCPSRSHYMLAAPRGKVLGYFGNAFTNGRGVGQRGNLRVPRQQVRQILLDQLSSKSTRLKWNHTLQNIGFKNGPSTTQVQDSITLEQPDQPISNQCASWKGPIQLWFANGTMDHADLVIAADGWRSTTLQCTTLKEDTPPQPRSLGIRIIVGLAVGVDHALVRESGFYTLGPGQRLFVMPFRGTTLDHDLSKRRTMWQLSFTETSTVSDSFDQASNNDSNGLAMSEYYWQQAKDAMSEWHSPVPQLVEATPISTVWGTLLHDRDPLAIWKWLQSSSSPVSNRMVVVGDALHAMSPFKGQGANQALADGAVVAQWLVRARLESAIQGAMREIVQRTAPVVQASREAALYWHSPDAWQQADQHTFAGVPSKIPTKLLQRTLAEANVSASSVEDLDSAIRDQLHHVYPGWQDSVALDAEPVNTGCVIPHTETLVRKALQAAERNDLETLRLLTWQGNPRLVQSIVDPMTGNNCLHQALLVSTKQDENDDDDQAENARVQEYWSSRQQLVQWLVTEAGCDLEQVNHEGRRPIDVALVESLGLPRKSASASVEGKPDWWEPLQAWYQQRRL